MSHKIRVTDYQWPSLDIEREVLGAVDAELVVAPDGEETTLVDLAAGCSGIMTCWAQTTRNVIAAALPDLKVIARYGIGLDNIDIPFATENGIPVGYVPTYCVDEVAEHTLAFILALTRKIGLFNRRTLDGTWDLSEGRPIYRLKDKKLGLVGFGHIGREVAKRAAAFGLEICVTDPVVTAEQAAAAGATLMPMDELLATADYICLHVPLSAGTDGLMGTEQFRQMKPTAYLINTARGGLVNEEALLAALQAGEIAGAALDVRREEPPGTGDQLLRMEQVLHSPHAAFYSVESVEDLQALTAWEVRHVLEGGDPANLVNPDYKKS